MPRTLEQMLPSERELMGHYSVVHSPDDDGYYADMWWDNTLDSPVFMSPLCGRRLGARERRNDQTPRFNLTPESEMSKSRSEELADRLGLLLDVGIAALRDDGDEEAAALPKKPTQPR